MYRARLLELVGERRDKRPACRLRAGAVPRGSLAEPAGSDQ